MDESEQVRLPNFYLATAVSHVFCLGQLPSTAHDRVRQSRCAVVENGLFIARTTRQHGSMGLPDEIANNGALHSFVSFMITYLSFFGVLYVLYSFGYTLVQIVRRWSETRCSERFGFD